MLTEAATGVNTPPRAVMMTVAELAVREGVSKPAISRKVKRLVGLGLVVERDEQGRVSGVNVAQYDHLRTRYSDPSKSQVPADAGLQSPPVAPNESYDEALRRKTWIAAARDEIKLAEEKGQLLVADRVAGGLAICGEEIARTIDRLVGMADEVTAAVAKDGVHGVRVLLKQIAFKMRGEVAASLERVAEASPASDEGTPADSEMAEAG